MIWSVWQKAQEVPGSPNFRIDAYGGWMQFERYGNRNSDFGWEIDHIYPRSKGGGDHFDNLQPLNWRNNVEKGDSIPGRI